MSWLMRLALIPILAACQGSVASVTELDPPVRWDGPIHEAEDLSAVTRFGDRLLLIASDEDGRIQVLEPTPGAPGMRVRPSSILPLGSDEEIDLEGLASQENRVYAIGSHGLRRKRLRSGDSYADNRRRVAIVEAPPARDHLFRLTLDPETGEPTSVESISLRAILGRDPILGPFSRIPGKENGVEIEGIAADGERLYLGFRSPILRSGHVPVMVLTFEQPESYELRFLDLGGRGVRDLARVEGGFLVLAGAEQPGPGAFEIYFWDGTDGLSGKRRRAGLLQRLGELPAPAGAAAEGLAVLEEADQEIASDLPGAPAESVRAYRVLVVYDGIRGGAPKRFLVTRTRRPAPSPG